MAGVLENMRLTVSSDSALKGFFVPQRVALDSIAEPYPCQWASPQSVRYSLGTIGKSAVG
jgi:hypothetical protein